jgi:hypothetical protein
VADDRPAGWAGAKQTQGPGWKYVEGVGRDLPDEAYREPDAYEQITDAKIYREIMLNRNGRILAAGSMWRIIGFNLGHNLVRVSLARDVR